MTTERPGITSFVNAVAGAAPDHDVHDHFVDWAERQVRNPKERALFRRMAERAGIDHRWSVLPPAPCGGSPIQPGGFYGGEWPKTSTRMQTYAEAAPALALSAIDELSAAAPLGRVSHLVVASCTGFVAPGLDQIIAERLGLGPVERTLVGFMGCYAAVAALRLAHHIVRSEPAARVLVVTVELSTLHLQDKHEIEPLLAMLQFSDGAAAALVTSEPGGFAISRPFAMAIPASDDLMRWSVVDTGFEMHLSSEVPARIGGALRNEDVQGTILNGWTVEDVDTWAVHAGGRSILDAVERGLALPQGALAASRDVLARFGNMSSSTLMFILAELSRRPGVGRGIAIAFGPGLAAEGFQFERTG